MRLSHWEMANDQQKLISELRAQVSKQAKLIESLQLRLKQQEIN